MKQTDIYKILENRLKFLAKTDISRHIILATHVPKGSYIYYASMPNRILVVDRGTYDARSEDAWERVGRKIKGNALPIFIMASNNSNVGVKPLYRYEDTNEIYPRYKVDFSKPIQVKAYGSNQLVNRILENFQGGTEPVQIVASTFKDLCLQLNIIGKCLDMAFGIDRTWKR